MAEPRFQDLQALTLEKERLNALRTHYTRRIERHWAAIRDGDVRSKLLRRAVWDTVLAWRPARMLEGLLGNGQLSSALGAAVFQRGGLWKRLLILATRWIGPYMLQRAGNLSAGTIIREVGITARRIREHMKARTNN
jgi:hypothetical protein